MTSGPLPGGYLASSWASSQDGGQIPRVTTTGEQGGIFTYLTLEVFPNVSPLHIRWPKYWGFSFSIIPSKEIPGLICRIDWLDHLVVQGTLKSLLQHHSSKASIVWFTCIQFGSVTQLCPTLCDPVNCSMPGLPIHYQLTESTQTHVH